MRTADVFCALPPGHFRLLPRKKNSEKGKFGHVLVIGGSRGMTGAPLLTGEAALRSGSGLVTLAVPRGLTQAVGRRALRELMFLPLPETAEGSLSGSARPPIERFIKKRHIRVLALGPGVSQVNQTQELVRNLVLRFDGAIVLDADGLNAFAGAPEALRKHKGQLVLTPHRREFERLFERRWPEREAVRVMLAKKLSTLYDGVLVLKGYRTLVVSGLRVYRNTTGNPGMAKGGSGDALTGVIAAFLAQGLGPFEAAAWAVYFHGRAGDLAARKTGELSLLAGDLIASLPAAFKRRSRKG